MDLGMSSPLSEKEMRIPVLKNEAMSNGKGYYIFSSTAIGGFCECLKLAKERNCSS